MAAITGNQRPRGAASPRKAPKTQAGHYQALADDYRGQAQVHDQVASEARNPAVRDEAAHLSTIAWGMVRHYEGLAANTDPDLPLGGFR